MGVMTKKLKHTQFGNPILRQEAAKVAREDIGNKDIQKLIADMRYLLVDKGMGVAMAAPQVGVSKAVVVVAVRPLAHRHTVQSFDLVLINPEVTETFGAKKPMYEGCISSGSRRTAFFFGQTQRYAKVTVTYMDEKGEKHTDSFEGLQAQIMQHEIDHLHGILFVDRVKDNKTFLTYSEYMKRARKILAKQTP